MSQITDKELETINKAVRLENELVTQLGAVEFKLKQLKDSKQHIIESMTHMLQERQANLDELRTKYNIDILNIDTGEYTVTK